LGAAVDDAAAGAVELLLLVLEVAEVFLVPIFSWVVVVPAVAAGSSCLCAQEATKAAAAIAVMSENRDFFISMVG